MSKCKICKKSVYPMDPQINLDGKYFHKACAKCQDCGCQISLSNFALNENGDITTLLCKTHYKARFNEAGGAYVGGDKFSKMSERDSKRLSSDQLASLKTPPSSPTPAPSSPAPERPSTPPVDESTATDSVVTPMKSEAEEASVDSESP